MEGSGTAFFQSCDSQAAGGNAHPVELVAVPFVLCLACARWCNYDIIRKRREARQRNKRRPRLAAPAAIIPIQRAPTKIRKCPLSESSSSSHWLWRSPTARLWALTSEFWDQSRWSRQFMTARSMTSECLTRTLSSTNAIDDGTNWPLGHTVDSSKLRSYPRVQACSPSPLRPDDVLTYPLISTSDWRL